MAARSALRLVHAANAGAPRLARGKPLAQADGRGGHPAPGTNELPARARRAAGIARGCSSTRGPGRRSSGSWPPPTRLR